MGPGWNTMLSLKELFSGTSKAAAFKELGFGAVLGNPALLGGAISAAATGAIMDLMITSAKRANGEITAEELAERRQKINAQLGAAGFAGGQIALMAASPTYRKAVLGALAVGVGVNAIDKVIKVTPTVINEAKTFASETKDNISTGWDNLANSVDSGVDTAVKGLNTAGNYIADTAKNTGEAVATGFNNLSNSVVSAGNNAVKSTSDFFKNAGNTVSNTLSSAWDGTTDWVDSTMQDLKQFTNNTTTNIKNFFKR